MNIQVEPAKNKYNMRYLERHEFSQGGYAQQDWDVVDYQLYGMDGVHFHLRGPITWDGVSDYIVFVGAAQTYGRYCSMPFPNLIGTSLSVPFINLGHAGAGPAYFILKPILKLLNSAKVVVLQVMSGRSVGTSLLENPRGDGFLKRRDLPNDPLCHWDAAWDRALEDYGSEFISNLVEEARANYIAQMKMLMHSIKVPKVLLWFAKRKPEYEDDFSFTDGFFKGFPQMINERVMTELRPHCENNIEIVSRRGVPQKLFNRFDGKIFEIANVPEERKTINNYYPTPEMHQDAADGLRPVLEQLICRGI